MQKPVLATVGMYVHPSVRSAVCPSVTLWHCVKMTQAIGAYRSRNLHFPIA